MDFFRDSLGEAATISLMHTMYDSADYVSGDDVDDGGGVMVVVVVMLVV